MGVDPVDHDEVNSIGSMAPNTSLGSHKSLTLSPGLKHASEGFEKAHEAPLAPNQQKPTAPPVEIRVTPHVPEWKDDDSVGEAACSGDENATT